MNRAVVTYIDRFFRQPADACTLKYVSAKSGNRKHYRLHKNIFRTESISE